MNQQPSSGLRVIITGVTGMVGEGVLHECLKNDAIKFVLAISRKPSGIEHPKFSEVIHTDFNNLSAIKILLTGFHACFFCLGVSSIGMKEKEYHHLTYNLTLHVAELLSRQNPGMVFCYISGVGTDSSEKGVFMWARVKGKTENSLMKLPFGHVYNFRPGVLEPTKGLKNTLGAYKYMGWLIPAIRALAPNRISTLQELGAAMINATTKGYEKQILEVKDIHALAKR